MKERATDELKQVEGMAGSFQPQQEIITPGCYTFPPSQLPNQAVEDGAWAMAKTENTLSVTKGPQGSHYLTIMQGHYKIEFRGDEFSETP